MHKKLVRTITWIAICTALTGCAATGRPYTEHMTTLKAQSPDSARIMVYRAQDTFQYSGRDARVALDEKTIGKVSHLGFSTFSVPPGKHVLSTDIWDSPGSCKLAIYATPESDSYFEIAPRSGNLVGMLAGGLIGAAIETAGKDCGGAFSIVMQPKEIAIPALTQLKASE